MRRIAGSREGIYRIDHEREPCVPYVVFELGARWGAGLHNLKGPLAAINALSCASEAQIYQVLADLGAELNLPGGSPAANVAYVKKLADLASTGHGFKGERLDQMRLLF